MRVISHRAQLLCQTFVLGIFHDTDDLDLLARCGAVNTKAPAERETVREEPLRHRFTNHRYLLGFVCVLRAKASTKNHGDSHRGEILPADEIVPNEAALPCRRILIVSDCHACPAALIEDKK